MSNVIQVNLIKTKQIKDRLCIYYWNHWGSAKKTNPDTIFSDKINYLLIHQNQILIKHLEILNKYTHLTKKRKLESEYLDILPVIINEVLTKINALIDEGKIPKKYSPTYVQLSDVYDKRKIPKDRINKLIQNCPFVVVVFKEQIISLIEQKFKDEEMQAIARLLKDLNSRSEGVSFDEYIDSWSKEILSEFKIKSIQNRKEK